MEVDDIISYRDVGWRGWTFQTHAGKNLLARNEFLHKISCAVSNFRTRNISVSLHLASQSGSQHQKKFEALRGRAAGDGRPRRGKNMVRSIRFWSQAPSVISPEPSRSGYSLTNIGSEVLGDEGWDQFLEDVRTLWLIHWNLSTNVENPLLAWDYLLNRAEPGIVPKCRCRKLKKRRQSMRKRCHPRR